MVDMQTAPPEDTASFRIPTPLIYLAIGYWVVAGFVAFSAYQDGYQAQARQVATLTDKGLLTFSGKLDRAALAKLAAEAENNRICRDAHPKPQGEPEPYYPAECGVYLPQDYAKDLDAATFADSHPDSANASGWKAVAKPLALWGLAFLGATGVLFLIGVALNALRPRA